MSARASPGVAATLSFIVPGLGQISAGAVVRGIVIAVPAAVVFLAAVALISGGPIEIAELVLHPGFLVGALVLNVVLAAYHVLAIIDAYRIAPPTPGPPMARRLGQVILAIVLTATLAIHGSIQAVGYQAYQTVESIFPPDDGGDAWAIPEPSFSPEPIPASRIPASPSPVPTSRPPAATPRSPSTSATPTATPAPTPKPTPRPKWATNGRLDLLLIGSDGGPDRWSLRTDSMIVLSIDVATKRGALFGIPRNMVGVPLPPESARAFRDGRFPRLLNALFVYAMGHPADFPGGDARGFRAVTGAIQELVGVPLDAVVLVNLAGFVRLVDAIGGLWIDVPERLVDRNYPLEDGSGHIRLDIRPGCQRLDGRTALAYARSRHQDSDYGRMRRQQQVLVALARQVDPLKLVRRVPKLLSIAKDDLWTTIKRTEVKDLAALAAHVDVDRVKTVLFVPTRYPSHLSSSEIARIRKVVRTAFEGARAATRPPPTTSDCP